MSGVLIRRLTRADEPAFRELWAGYLAFYRADIPETQTSLTWGRLFDPLEPFVALGADRAGALVGFALSVIHRSTWAERGYLYLEDLFVAEAARGAGAGRALIEAVYGEADRLGLSRVYWATEAQNDAARRLYDRVATLSPYVQYRRR